MPLIRLAGRHGGLAAAGQAASAYNGATADARRNAYRQREAQQRLEQHALDRDVQLRIAEMRAGQAALSEFNTQAHRDRTHALASKRESRLSAVALSGADTADGRRAGVTALPISGRSAWQMMQEVAALDPGAGSRLMLEAREMLGQDIETPEEMDDHPALGAIYSRAARMFTDTKIRTDERRIQGGHDRLVQQIEEESPGWLNSSEGQQWAAGMHADVAPVEDPGEAERRLKRHRSLALQQIRLGKERRHYAEAAQALIEEKVTGEGAAYRRRKALELVADMYDTDDPERVFAKVLAAVDPSVNLAARIAAEEARFDATIQSAVNEVRGAPTGGEPSVPTAPGQSTPTTPTPEPPADGAGRVPFGSMRGLEEILDLAPDDEFRHLLGQDLRAAGIDPSDQDAIATHIKAKLTDGPGFDARYARKFMPDWAVDAMLDSIVGEG